MFILLSMVKENRCKTTLKIKGIITRLPEVLRSDHPAVGPAPFQQSRWDCCNGSLSIAWDCCNGSLSIARKVTMRAVQKVADKIVPLKSSLTNNLILFDNELQSYLFQFGFS